MVVYTFSFVCGWSCSITTLAAALNCHLSSCIFKLSWSPLVAAPSFVRPRVQQGAVKVYWRCSFAVFFSWQFLARTVVAGAWD
ncbi:hypothetical protein O6P43_020266 [Quillaja saponaria]|uniref:Uncharacterized protein n=1 Tax=Quillaja saponaria TaxID=32244 RepID=A0AAD7PM13_QUISA|nr:hypothetical protein O6P43_020266 [Quillaja saponaria]